MIGPVLSPEVESARQQWREGTRRLESFGRDPRAYGRLVSQIEVLTAELRRRVGGVFTLGELADVYRAAEPWTLEVLGEGVPEPGWERHATVVLDATFELYARGASDYRP